MVKHLSDADHAAISAAVGVAEAASDGEIVTVIAPRSDAYHDVGLHYAVLAMLLVPAALAFVPQGWIDWWTMALLGWGGELTRGIVMLAIFVKLVAVFLIVRFALAWMPLRMALTPAATKRRRVHRRARELFRTTCELKTRGRTGVLLYLSLAEHRAEIVADKAIADQVEPTVWGEAMTVLIEAVKDKRPGDGMVAAVGQIGTVLARILPPRPDNPNELPDRVIEL
jgi:putative membrane protein